MSGRLSLGDSDCLACRASHRIGVLLPRSLEKRSFAVNSTLVGEGCREQPVGAWWMGRTRAGPIGPNSADRLPFRYEIDIGMVGGAN